MYSNSSLEDDNILVHFNVSSSFEATSWLLTHEKSKVPGT